MDARIEREYWDLVNNGNREEARELVMNWYRDHPDERAKDFEKILDENADVLKRLKDM